MSENDESNIEAPSPVTPVKSPDKSQDSPPTPPVKKDSIAIENQLPSLLNTAVETVSTPPSPATPPSVHEMPALPTVAAISSPSVPMVEATAVKPQPVVKPAILRFGVPEEYPPVSSGGVGVFGHNGKPHVQGKSTKKKCLGKISKLHIAPSNNQVYVKFIFRASNNEYGSTSIGSFQWTSCSSS